MGYYSNFLVSITKKDQSAFTDEEKDALVKEVESYGNKADDINESFDNKTVCLFFYQIKWYDSNENLADFTRKHPDIRVYLEREGEDHDDTEELTFLDGNSFDVSPFEIDLPTPGSGMVLVASFDQDTGTLQFDLAPDETRPALETKEGRTTMVVKELISKMIQRKILTHIENTDQ